MLIKARVLADAQKAVGVSEDALRKCAQKELQIELSQSAQVKELRSEIAKQLGDSKCAKALRLIAFGKVLHDKNASGDAALLYNDYGFPSDVTVVLVTAAPPIKTEEQVRKERGECKEDEKVFMSENELRSVAGRQQATAESSTNAVTTITKEQDDKLHSRTKKIVCGFELGRIPDDEAEPNADEDEHMRHCKDCRKDPRRECEHCGCMACHSKRHAGFILLCDGYDSATGTACPNMMHMFCQVPPMTAMPAEDEAWFCNKCIEERERLTGKVVTQHELAERSKKKSEAVSAKTKRNWGGGQSTAGHEKLAHVDTTRRGPVPGIAVGQCFHMRADAAAWGVHTQQMCGIMTGGEEGAQAICVSHGYDDDADNGESLIYTGEGGKDLSGNKRNNKTHEKNQQLMRGNLGLARTVYGVGVNPPVEGADAGDNWRKSKAIRVLRGAPKDKKYIAKRDPNSRAAQIEPDEGYRYDGIYKIVKYWPKTRSDGNTVYQFEMRRDDPSPAPWTHEGKAAMQNMRMLFTNEYVMKTYYERKVNGENVAPGSKRSIGGGASPATKRAKGKEGATTLSTVPSHWHISGLPVLPLPEDLKKLIDDAPKRFKAKWRDTLTKYEQLRGGLPMLIKAVNEEFSCPSCYKTLADPDVSAIRLPCDHVICTVCWGKMHRAQHSRARIAFMFGNKDEGEQLMIMRCPICRVSAARLKAEHAEEKPDDCLAEPNALPEDTELQAHLWKVLNYGIPHAYVEMHERKKAEKKKTRK